MTWELHDAVVVDLNDDRDLLMEFMEWAWTQRIFGLGGSQSNGATGSYWGPFAAEHRPAIEAFFKEHA